MKLAWLGRYRKLIGALMKNGNLYSRASVKRNTYELGVEITAMEWQVLETIYEHDEQILNMAQLSATLGLAHSNFSKYVKTLCELGLVDRFTRRDNSKDIVLRLSEKGKQLYTIRANAMTKEYLEIFRTLEDVPDEYLEKFCNFLQAMNQNYLKYMDKSYSLDELLTKKE